MRLGFASTLAALAASAGGVSLQAQGLVYSATTPTTNAIYQGSQEFGEEVDLVGTGLKVTSFVLAYFGDFAPNVTSASGELRIYADDGPSQGYLGPTGATNRVNYPGTLLVQTASFSLQPGYHEVQINLPSVPVGDSLSWTVQFAGLRGVAGSQAGLLLANLPSIGTAGPGGNWNGALPYWVHTDPTQIAGWDLYTVNSGAPGVFVAQVYAVPEPGTWALAALGVAGLWFFKRRV